MVGREQELELLLQRWHEAMDGSGQVVMLSGEAGIGKSRLVQALIDRTTKESINDLHCRCSPYYRNSANYPAIELLQRILLFDRKDDSETKLSKLEENLRRFGFSLPETVPLFASLLSLTLGERYSAPSRSSAAAKAKDARSDRRVAPASRRARAYPAGRRGSSLGGSYNA